MKHHQVVTFDNALRKAWYSLRPYPLSAALLASAKMKPGKNIQGNLFA